jgi:hypothetical protein
MNSAHFENRKQNKIRNTVVRYVLIIKMTKRRSIMHNIIATANLKRSNITKREIYDITVGDDLIMLTPVAMCVVVRVLTAKGEIKN